MFRSVLTGGLALLLFFAAPAVRASEEESPNDSATHLSTLGRAPDWSELEKFQNTMTHDTFVDRLAQVYCLPGYDPNLIEVEEDSARILKTTGTQDYFVLRFAKSEAERLPVSHWWAVLANLPQTPGQPLAGWHIALDPGHLGGDWAKMEERWFQIGDAAPVKEGDMTLQVAKLLAPRLESLGAKVSLLREKSEPITPYRPSDFEEIARQLLQHEGIRAPRENFAGPADPEKEKTVAWQRELLFYRNSEIRRRPAW